MIAFLRSVSILALAAGTLAAWAAPATYTLSGIGTGTLDGTAFTNQAFSLVGTGDTSGIFTNSAGYPALAITTSVAVSGLASDRLTDTIDVVDNRSSPAAGFGDTTQNRAVLYVSNAAFATYGLATSIGPLSGSLFYNGGYSFPTARGAFVLSSATTASFTTVVQATPEPAPLAALGLCAAAVLRRRKRA